MPKRTHRWLRWSLAGAGAIVVLLVVAVALVSALAPVPALFSLPEGPVAAPIGPLAGTWVAGPGSKAGFRMAETVLFITKQNVSGLTNAVSGSLSARGDEVVNASFEVDLRKVKVGGKAQPQFAKSLATARHPYATFALTQRLPLGKGLATGRTVHLIAIGRLGMNGASRIVSFTVSGRRNGAVLQIAGFTSISLAGWGIRAPAGLGPLGSLTNHGVVEFALRLHRA